MQIRYLLATLVALAGLGDIQAKPCQCYCSYGKGPRDMRPGDTPHITQQSNINDSVYNICFCADRDIKKFAEIDLEPPTEHLNALNCCGSPSFKGEAKKGEALDLDDLDLRMD